MKKSILILSILCAVTFYFSSCEKDEGELPNLTFKTGGDYLNHSDTVQVGDTVLVGIRASKAEEKDPLKSFDASVSFDGAASSSFFSESLSGSNESNYEKDFTIVARKQEGKETYTFTVVNKDGLKRSASLTLVVVP